MPIQIKICGITRYEDARVAANLGVNALGFIFYTKSPRYISPADARAVIDQLPPFVARVGVFVDTPPEDIVAIAQQSGINAVQLHGAESPAHAAALPFPVIKAFSVKPGFDLASLDEYRVSGHLLDTWDPRLKGGVGKTFDWTVAQRAVRQRDTIILSGGLGPANIAEALESVQPYGIDVNSGVEIRPGEKNPMKMRDVVKIVRGWR